MPSNSRKTHGNILYIFGAKGETKATNMEENTVMTLSSQIFGLEGAQAFKRQMTNWRKKICNS